MPLIRIGTRKSPLARWQAGHVSALLRRLHPDVEVELVELTTQGDRFLGTPLSAMGGKGLFLKELEEALLSGYVDVAVHSMKDVTVELPPGLHIAVVCERANPFDALVSNRYASLDGLPENATVGTTSLRRQCQLRHAYPKLQMKNVRGNVNTRLDKLDHDEFDAIVLAAAGLERLDLAARIRSIISPQICTPAVGQGVVGLECRRDDVAINERVASLDHAPTHCRVRAERAANAALGGGCHVPIGIYAELDQDTIALQGMVGRLDGSQIIRSRVSGDSAHAESIGATLAEQLLSAGADQILRQVYSNG